MIRMSGWRCSGRSIMYGAGALFLCSWMSLAAQSITGVVRNQTDGRPAVGDEVILLGTGESARSETDSQGSFRLELRHSGVSHIVRVIHQGVTYDRQVSSGGALSLDVADAAGNVRGITGGIEIIRVGTQGSLLHVSDMIEIQNLSSPPMTQAGGRTFEVSLPVNARIESAMAAGPENIGTIISAAPVRGEPGRFTVNFPLRPGSTKFAFNYDLPYEGRVDFHPRSLYPLQQLAVMLPPAMRFLSKSSAFQTLPVGSDRYQVVAAERLKAGAEPEFEISGVGAMPSLQPHVRAHPGSSGTVFTPPAPSNLLGAQARVRTAPGAAAVSEVRTPSLRSLGWILGAGAFGALGYFGALLKYKKHMSTSAAITTGKETEQRSASLVEALKEGLFQLESDRLQGIIPGEEYACAKQALEGTIAWALARVGARPDAARH